MFTRFSPFFPLDECLLEKKAYLRSSLSLILHARSEMHETFSMPEVDHQRERESISSKLQLFENVMKDMD